jgi:hypothetical protein
MKKLIAFEQNERLALKIAELLKGLSYEQANGVLITVDRILKENSVFDGVISDT